MDAEQVRWALITGASGEIGQALVRAFSTAGYAVIGTDVSRSPGEVTGRYFIQADLRQLVAHEPYAVDVLARVRAHLNGGALKVLVNNAAVQTLGKVEDLTRQDWHACLETNLLAPFLLVQALLPELERARGCVINVSSIHARLSKPKFAAYATSKAALSGLTRSLALEVGDRIRVNAIEPAAVDTEMLKAGLEDMPDAFSQLEKYHPTQSIAKPEEIGQLAISLADGALPFLNGAAISLDGGIGGRLHDPT